MPDGRDAVTRGQPHDCEAWQLRKSDKGGLYCAVCGFHQGRHANHLPTPTIPSDRTYGLSDEATDIWAQMVSALIDARRMDRREGTPTSRGRHHRSGTVRYWRGDWYRGTEVRPIEWSHISGCHCWHHQGGDYDRDCPACMQLAAQDEALQRRRER